ncbi:MAG: hypothetical protein WBR13_02315 [Allosphingosinicella sp.]
MAVIDPEADVIVRTLRETALSWLGDVAAEAIADLEEMPRDTREQRVYAAKRQLEEVRRSLLSVVKLERQFTSELGSIAPQLGIRNVVFESPDGELVELTSQERTAALDRFASVLQLEIEGSLRAARLREGYPE